MIRIHDAKSGANDYDDGGDDRDVRDDDDSLLCKITIYLLKAMQK